MRLRLILRRLTVSAPRMAVRSALPWPFRWAVVAIVFGFCAAIALWAFEFGKGIAGLEKGSKAELQQSQSQLGALRAEVLTLRQERDRAQSIANTVDTLLTSEKVAQERLLAQNKQLEVDNQSLRDDLGFFEKLIPTAGADSIAIRGLQAELHNGREIKWQVLVIQALKSPPEFNGRLELTFTGVLHGKPWSAALPGGAQAFKLRQYGRLEGTFELPPQAVVRSLTAKILDGSLTKTVQSVTL
ncbi:DUF6776 family protein [Rhodoferax ferrireducens]|uniref:DUF6776 family protein n=1 Tax=Rhodoferax ferrireducens TaxID=192843 RepID=UPI000E0E01F3|nr:DUF6776 family protein [Rhodoferax ferrireducens]